MRNAKLAQGLTIAGLGVIGLVIAFLLFMGIGEMAGGDFSGLSHVIPAVILAGLAALSLKWLRGSGATLAAVGLLIGAYFLAQSSSLQARITATLLTGAPILLGGVLLLAAAGLGKRAERA